MSRSADPSPLSTLDPRTVVLLYFVLLLGIVLTPNPRPLSLLCFALLLTLTAALARIDRGEYLRSMKRAGPLVLLIVIPVALLQALITPGAAAWLHAAGLVLKVTLAVSVMIILRLALPFNVILATLRRLRLPGLFLDMLALAYRYLDVLDAERVQLVRALAARGYTPRWIWQSGMPGKLAGSLFLRSVERAERIHLAMLARGYEAGNTGTRSTMDPSRLTILDYATLAVTLGLSIIILGSGL